MRLVFRWFCWEETPKLPWSLLYSTSVLYDYLQKSKHTSLYICCGLILCTILLVSIPFLSSTIVPLLYLQYICIQKLYLIPKVHKACSVLPYWGYMHLLISQRGLKTLFRSQNHLTRHQMGAFVFFPEIFVIFVFLTMSWVSTSLNHLRRNSEKWLMTFWRWRIPANDVTHSSACCEVHVWINQH